jgi:hypothetical protein
METKLGKHICVFLIHLKMCLKFNAAQTTGVLLVDRVRCAQNSFKYGVVVSFQDSDFANHLVARNTPTPNKFDQFVVLKSYVVIVWNLKRDHENIKMWFCETCCEKYKKYIWISLFCSFLWRLTSYVNTTLHHLNILYVIVCERNEWICSQFQRRNSPSLFWSSGCVIRVLRRWGSGQVFPRRLCTVSAELSCQRPWFFR